VRSALAAIAGGSEAPLRGAHPAAVPTPKREANQALPRAARSGSTSDPPDDCVRTSADRRLAHAVLSRGIANAASRQAPIAEEPKVRMQGEETAMETMLREAKEQSQDIPSSVKEQIVLEHAPLIRYIVNRIAVRLPSHIDLDDLHNTGVIGLMDAIEKYDPEKNCKFKTYAEFRIKGAILDQLRSLDWVPRSVRQKGRRLERAYGEVEQRLGRSASEEEVADSLGLQIEKFHELLNQVRGVSLVNLEELRGAGSEGERTGSYADIVEDVHSENPYSALKQQEMRRVIAETIGSLPDKERLVLTLYYYEDLNMKEIGSILGITESRVCQIHTKAVGRLRSKLKSLTER
jgi:RNA polymerase sigma factor for flagellar operon FliA